MMKLNKKKKDRKQANIQGIHCIIKTTTGNRRWGLGEFLFLFFFWFICLFVFRDKKEKKILSFFPVTFSRVLSFWPVSRTDISPSIDSTRPRLPRCRHLHNFNMFFHLPYLRSLLNIQNTSPQQPQHINVHCLAVHSGQRLRFSFVILLSLLSFGVLLKVFCLGFF